MKKGCLKPVRVGLAATFGTVLVTAATSAQAQEPLWLGWDLSLEGAFVTHDTGAGNVFAQDITLAPTGVTSANRRIDPDRGYSLRFQARLRTGDWDFGVAYRGTLLDEAEESSDLRVGAPLSITVPVSPGFVTVPVLGPVPLIGTQAVSRSDTDIGALDFVAGYSLSRSWGELRFFGGIRYARIVTDTNTRFSLFGLLPGSVDRRERFWGVGPRVGSQITIPFLDNWRLWGSVSGSVLFGDQDLRIRETLNVPALGLSFAEQENHGGMRTGFSFDGELSVGYVSARGFYFALGYGFQSYLGVADRRYVDTLASINAGRRVTRGSSAEHHIVHGPFVRLGWRFGGYARPESGDAGHLYPEDWRPASDWTFDFSIEGGPSFVDQSDENVYAQNVRIAALTPAGVTQSNATIEPGDGWTGRIAARFRPGQHWDYGVAYRGVASGEGDEASRLTIDPTAPSVVIPVFPDVINGVPLIGTSPIVGTVATASSESQAHFIDIEAGYTMSLSWSELRLFGGVRIANFRNSFDARYSLIGLVDFNINREVRYWGAGPRVGAGLDIPLSTHWTLSGSVAGAVLFGHRETDINKSLSVPLAGATFADSERNGGGRTAATLDSEIAVTYTTERGFYFSVGYGMQSIFGVNDTRYRSINARASLSSLSLVTSNQGTSGGHQITHGPFLRAGIRF